MLFCLVQCCASTATENAAETIADGRAGEEMAAHEVEQSGVRRVLSSIIELFRGRSEETAPGPEQGREQAREPAPEDARAPPAKSQPAQGPERGDDPAEVTHSHVYRAALDIVAEIDILRDAHENTRDAQAVILERPAEPALQPGQRSIHALVKSMEVMHKTAHVQRRLGMIPVEPGHVPLGPVAPHDVLRNVDSVIEELRRIKRQLVVTREIEPTPFAGAKIPSLVTRHLGHASLLLDDLVGRAPTPGEVHDYVSRVHEQLELVGASLGAALEPEAPAAAGPRTPVECAQQVLRAIYKAIGLQSRLGMDASTVPDLMLAQITASGVLDAVGILLAEVVRIGVHLGIDTAGAELREPGRKQWRDVFALTLLVVENLDRVTSAVDEPDPGDADTAEGRSS